MILVHAARINHQGSVLLDKEEDVTTVNGVFNMDLLGVIDVLAIHGRCGDSHILLLAGIDQKTYKIDDIHRN